MIFRAHLDLTASDVAYGLAATVRGGDRAALEGRVRAALPDGDRGVVCLSVRSGFDLLLSALALPEGSEVLMTAVTVPDMVRVVRAHGLVPVPVDIDPVTLAPHPEALARAVGPRARVLVAAHLFGAVSDLEPARAVAREHGLVFVEDCAQSWVPGGFSGAADSDVRMLSFGPIKTSTALGGGVLLVADGELRAAMEEIQATRPVQPRTSWLVRCLKYGATPVVGREPVFGLFRAVCRLAGRDFDEVLKDLARSFRGDEILDRLRARPSLPLLHLLARRLERPSGRVPARAEAGRELAARLGDALRRPGSGASPHTHWLFPVETSDRAGLKRHLRRAGFDATSGASSLTVVPVPPDRPDTAPRRAERLLERILFVPAYPEVPRADRVRLADVLAAWGAREGDRSGEAVLRPAPNA